MNDRDERRVKTHGARHSRRNFSGALGAAAAAGALLESFGGGAKAQSPPTVWYQDSFGNIVPAGSGTLALGITPSPHPPPPSGSVLELTTSGGVKPTTCSECSNCTGSSSCPPVYTGANK